MIHHGDLFGVLPMLEDDSLDAGVTDPPYGIGFMGKEWDTFTPLKVRSAAAMKQRKDPALLRNLKNVYGRKRSPAQSPNQIKYNRTLLGQRGFQEWTERWAREVYRVLKPGAHMVVCGAPRSAHRMACGLEDAGFEVRDTLAWIFGQGFPKSKDLGDGVGTALKPAYEPIVLVRKPFRGSVTRLHDVLGTGGLAIDACRVPFTGPEDAAAAAAAHRTVAGQERSIYGAFVPEHGQASLDAYLTGIESGLGRWPANIVIDAAMAQVLDITADDNVSRFFYCPKPSREERDWGCDDLPARSGGAATDRAEGSAGLRSPRAGAGRTGGARNIHPTVKPLALMRWLVRLVTPPGGVVLDPFLGSGSTGMACRAEHRPFIGIEREAEYVDIATRRINAVAPLFADAETVSA